MTYLFLGKPTERVFNISANFWTGMILGSSWVKLNKKVKKEICHPGDRTQAKKSNDFQKMISVDFGQPFAALWSYHINFLLYTIMKKKEHLRKLPEWEILLGFEPALQYESNFFRLPLQYTHSLFSSHFTAKKLCKMAKIYFNFSLLSNDSWIFFSNSCWVLMQFYDISFSLK